MYDNVAKVRAISRLRGIKFIEVSEKTHQRFQRHTHDNLRVCDGPFRYADVNPDGTTFPRFTCNGVELRIVRGLRKPVGVV